MNRNNITGDGTKARESARERIARRLQERYPDRQFTDEEEFYDALDEYDNALSQHYEQMLGDQNRLCQMMCSNPKMGAFISDVADGEDVLVACVRYFGKDMLDHAGDERYMHAIRRANEEFEARNRHYMELEESMRHNVEQSARHIERFMRAKQMDEAEFDDFLDRVFHICQHVFAGDLTIDVLELLYKGLHYDTDLTCAEHAAEIKGRNERITLSRRDIAGDHLPALPHKNGGNETGGYRRPRRRRSIWDM